MEIFEASYKSLRQVASSDNDCANVNSTNHASLAISGKLYIPGYIDEISPPVN